MVISSSSFSFHGTQISCYQARTQHPTCEMELARRIPRCSSPAASSACSLSSPRPSIDRNPGLVPFLWETSPGLPKPYPNPASHDLATPRLPLPPILQSPYSFSRCGQLLPASLISPPPRHSLVSRMKKMFTRQRGSFSRSFIDASAVRRAQLECVETCDVSARKDVVLTMRESTSTSAGLAVGFEEDNLVAESSKNYLADCEPDCSPRSCQLDGNIFSPAWKPTPLRVVSSFSSSSRPRSLSSVSPSSLTNSTCSSATFSSHDQPSARGASEFAAKMCSDVESSKKSALHSKSCRSLAENSSSALDKRFSCHKGVFSEEDFTHNMKIRSSRIGSDALDGNVASEVQFPLEFAAKSESTRSFTSFDFEEFHCHQDFTAAGCWDPWKKRKKIDSLDAIFSAFDIIQGASTELPQVKDKKWHSAKASCLPKMRSTSQRWVVSPFKSISKAGI